MIIQEVKVTNEGGSVISGSVTIVANEPVTITKQPNEARVIQGGSVVFEVLGNRHKTNNTSVAV